MDSRDECDTRSTAGLGARDSSPTPGRDSRIAPVRVAGRAAWSTLLSTHLHGAARRGISLVVSWEHRLGVSEQTIRDKWANSLHESALTCGDVHALPPADRLALLERWVEATRAELRPVQPAQSPVLLALQATVRAGRLSEQAAEVMSPTSPGGTDVTRTEWLRVEALCAEGEEELRTAKLAARAAAEKGR